MTKEINNSPVTVEEAVAARPDYENEIIAVVRGTASPKAAQQKLEDYHDNDIAQAMASLTLPERKKLFRICTADMLAEAFEHLEEEDAVAYFNGIYRRGLNCFKARLCDLRKISFYVFKVPCPAVKNRSIFYFVRKIIRLRRGSVGF